MAEKFSTILEETAQVIAPPVQTRTPSPFGTALEGVSSMLGTYMSTRDNARQARKEKEKAAKEAEAQAASGYVLDQSILVEQGIDPFSVVSRNVVNTPSTQNKESTQSNIQALRGASNQDLATAIVDDSVATGEIDKQTVDELAGLARSASKEVAVQEQAISQGKLPPISKDALMDRVLQEARAKFPHVDVKVLASTLEAFGLKNSVFNQVRKDTLDNEALDKANRDVRTRALEAGLASAGPAGEFMSQEDLIKTGLELIQGDEVVRRTKDQIEITKGRQDISKAEREMAEKDTADTLRVVTLQQVQGQLAPFLTALNEAIVIAGTPGADPNIEAKIESIKLHLGQMSGVIIENAIGQMAIEDVGQAEQMRTYLKNYLQNSFLGPLETRDQSVSNLTKKLKDKIGLEITTSMPFITMAREAGMSVSLIDSLMGAVDGDTANRIKQELTGLAKLDLNTALNRDTGILYVKEIMDILKGNNSLASKNFTPETAKKAFSTLTGVSRSISQEIQKGNFENADTFLNVGGEYVVAAGALNQQSGERALNNAMLLVTERGRNRGIINSLINNPEYADEAKLYGLATRAAAAKVLMGLKAQDRSEGFHNVRWDNQSGSYVVAFDREGWNKANPARNDVQLPWRYGGIGNTLEGPRANVPSAPSRLVELASTMNTGITYLSSTTDWDDEAPKGSDRELRNWYGQNRPTEDMRKKASTKKGTEGSQSDVLRKLDQLDQALIQGRLPLEAPTAAGAEGISINADGTASARTSSGSTVTVRPVAAIQEQYKDNPIFKTVVNRAQATGMPVDLVVSLIGNMENRSFSNKASAKTRRGRAYGVMQVHDADWDSTAQQRYGKQVKDLSPEQNIDLGLWILAQNYKSTGNWADALSMYHSGVSLAKAKEQKRDDGNIATDQYVALILQGAGMQ